MQDRFKQVYEVPKAKSEAAGVTFGPRNEKCAKSQCGESERGGAISCSQRSVRDECRSCRSSECSECSGAHKKGMEYVCVSCLNREMAEDKRYRLEREREEKCKYDITQRKQLEQEQARQREELEYSRRKMRNDLATQVQNSHEKRRLEQLERYSALQHRKLPQPTTILNDDFGRDYARDRAGARFREQERFNERIAPELMEKVNQESAKKEFM